MKNPDMNERRKRDSRNAFIGWLEKENSHKSFLFGSGLSFLFRKLIETIFQ